MAGLKRGIPEKIIKEAKRFVGMQFKKHPPPVQFDCSSFTQKIYAKYRIQLPRTSIQQSQQGIFAEKTDLQMGDLLFFYVPDKHPTNDIVGHVGIYAGRQRMIHCIPTSNIFLTSINKPHWQKTYLFARRVIELKQNTDYCGSEQFGVN
jgi:cell wall-associated NlpC family hydrolase